MSDTPPENKRDSVATRPMSSNLPGAKPQSPRLKAERQRAQESKINTPSGTPVTRLKLPPSRLEEVRDLVTPGVPVLRRTEAGPKNFSRVPRRSRRSLRREERRRRIFLIGLSLLVVLGSLMAGYLWKNYDLRRLALAEKANGASAEEQAEALRLVNEAVEAVYEGRLTGALNAIASAQEEDPNVLGADILMGGLALSRRDSAEVERLSHGILARGGSEVAQAKLLLGLNSWFSRDVKSGLNQSVANLAQLTLAEAASDELSSYEIWRWRGYLGRATGLSSDVQNAYIGAVHRHQPWTSAEVIAAKMQLAAWESGRSPGLWETSGGQALSALKTASVTSEDTTPALRALVASVSASQAMWLLSDPGLASSTTADQMSQVRAASFSGIPYARTSSATRLGPSEKP